MEQTIPRKVFLIGIGMGGPEQLTGYGAECLRQVQAVAGASRMVESVRELTGEKPCRSTYRAEEAVRWLESLTDGTPGFTAAMVFSGDTGFFSGAGEAKKVFEASGWEAELVPGISSLSYLAARLGMDWQEVWPVSLHGREADYAAAIRDHGRCFLLLGGQTGPKEVCLGLFEAGMGDCRIAFGAELSYPDERILTGTAEELLRLEGGRPLEGLPGLVCAFVEWNGGDGKKTEPESALESRKRSLGCGKPENGGRILTEKAMDGEERLPAGSAPLNSGNELAGGAKPDIRNGQAGTDEKCPRQSLLTGIARAFSIKDREFLRGPVPMTKEEIRTLSLAKLELKPGSVLWDVGAGTGSVGIAAGLALSALGGQVYAVEKDPEAARLITENRKRLLPETAEFFLAEGKAPEILENLPAPTHVFIGGSGGNLLKILALILEQNSGARIVVNAVTLETMALCLEAMKRWEFSETEVIQAGIARSEAVGPFHMQRAGNPVYIVTLQGKG